jgi:hypothetical protein
MTRSDDKATSDADFINALREWLGLEPLHQDGRSLRDSRQIDWLPAFAQQARSSRNKYASDCMDAPACQQRLH